MLSATVTAATAAVGSGPWLRRDWIEINGPARAAARIQISRRSQNREIWDALVAAGAHPLGLPPQADR